MKIKAISLHQPWATMVALGWKTFETRSWPTNYRGPLAIHAAKTRKFARGLFCDETFHRWLVNRGYASHDDLPYGAVVALVDLTEVWKVEQLQGQIGSQQRSWGDYSPGRYAWQLKNIVKLQDIPAVGRQRLWNWEVPEQLQHLVAGRVVV